MSQVFVGGPIDGMKTSGDGHYTSVEFFGGNIYFRDDEPDNEGCWVYRYAMRWDVDLHGFAPVEAQR